MNTKTYQYKPVAYHLWVFGLTWIFWFLAVFVSRSAAENGISTVLLLLGLIVPSITSLVFILRSNSPALKKDYVEKLKGFYRVNLPSIFIGVLIFGGAILISILVSLLLGQSADQFSFTGGFSFSIGGVSTLLVLVLTASLEELGWRGYAEDSLANYLDWFRESILSDAIWAVWHLPLFLMVGTYQYNILQMSPWYMVNFFISILPLGFLMTWVYVKNDRSILGCVIFHFFVNFFQEMIAMTQVTKCIQTVVLALIVAALVLTNKELFFGTKHVGDILGEKTAVETV